MIFDIAFNITDKAFEHDFDEVINRSRKSRVFPILVGHDIKSSIDCANFAQKYKLAFYSGIHPTYTLNTPPDYLEQLKALLSTPRCIALGEIGLDFDRLHFSPKNTQIDIFKSQIGLAKRNFFHSRNAHRQFMEIISDFQVEGVVHSFTGLPEESNELIKRGLFIGINGCSLKRDDLDISLDNILIETDSSYCLVKDSRIRTELKDLKKKRNEPAKVIQVAEVLGEIHGVSVEEVIRITNENAINCFGNDLVVMAEEFFKV